MSLHAEHTDFVENVSESPLSERPTHGKVRKILVVEDEPHVSRTLAQRLNHSGLEPIMAVDAISAVQAARVHRPQLALLDIGLPGCDGFFVAEQVREVIGADLPIIFITASSDPSLIERAKRFEPAAFFRKPYRSELLMASVNAAL